MVTLRMRIVSYEEREFDIEDVMSLKDAAELAGVSLQVIITAVGRCALTELLDPDAIHRFRDRRYVLRSEIEKMAEDRRRRAEKWGEVISIPAS